MQQVGYRHIHWAHQTTNIHRTEMGTHDDFFVRTDVTLLKEEGWNKEALKEKLSDMVKEELASDLKVEVEQLLDSGKVNLPARGEREDL